MSTTPAGLDAAIRKFLDDAAAADAPPITAGPLDQARRSNADFLATMRTRDIEVGFVEDLVVSGGDGPLPARRYHPTNRPRASVVFFHGGGWVLGDLEGHDQLCRAVCERLEAVVTSVNYRHAPEYPFPAAAEDAFAAVAGVAAEHSELPIVVMGDSSGGNLAASVALQARDAGMELALQILLYPVLDYDLDTESYRRNGTGYLLTRDDMEWFWSQYVPDPSRRRHPLASPLRARSFEGIAPAVIVAAGFDPLYDEACAFGDKLVAAGVEAEVQRHESMIHGFSTLFAVTPEAEKSVFAALDSARRWLPTTSTSNATGDRS